MIYCEQLLANNGFEPWNALTNMGFGAAAIWGYLAFRRAGLSTRLAPRLLVTLTVAIGLGSFAWHATGAPWAQWADVLPILGFVLLFLGTALSALCGATVAFSLAACIALVAAAAGLLALSDEALNGSLAYVPVWCALLGMTWQLRHTPAHRAFAFATLLFAVSLSFRTLDLALCDLSRLRGTHWLWHLCNAGLVALLMHTLARHARVART